jgi:hypothetical protein
MLPSLSPDIQALHAILETIESLADKASEAGRVQLADFLDYFRPKLSAAALNGDERAFSDALSGLSMMVRRFVMMTTL